MNKPLGITERGVAWQSPVEPMNNEALLNRMAALVGLVAIGLPVILGLGGSLEALCFRDSISHFYYDPYLGTVFVGGLVFIGGFLFAYSGEHWIENVGSSIAGTVALATAMIPTVSSGCEAGETFASRVFATAEGYTPVGICGASGAGFFQLFGFARDLHLIAAGVLLLYLALYCLIVMRRILPRHYCKGVVLDSKRKRNRLYFWCGIIIIACVTVLTAVAFTGERFQTFWKNLNLTFFLEALALWAFGLAWIVKGRLVDRFSARYDDELCRVSFQDR